MHRAATILLSLFCCLVIFAGIYNTAPVSALDTNTSCITLAQDALNSVKQSCSTTNTNSVCVGFGSIQAILAGGSLKAQGDQADLAKLTSLTTAAADPAAGKWGVA